jgi:hypothetical protein
MNSNAELQMALQAKAKGGPSYRFYLLYDRLYRKDVLGFVLWHFCDMAREANNGRYKPRSGPARRLIHARL